MFGSKWVVWLIVPLALALGSPVAAQPEPGDGSVYEQPILVKHPDGEFEWTSVYLVRQPDGRVAIVDKNARTYESKEDFLENNTLFTEDDTITLPRDFPAVDRPGGVELVTIPGRTPDRSWIWWTAGGVAAVVGLLLLMWFRHRRKGMPAFDHEPPP